MILGGGFAGSQIARDLRGKRRVTVVETKSYFEFVPGTPSPARRARPRFGGGAGSIYERIYERDGCWCL